MTAIDEVYEREIGLTAETIVRQLLEMHDGRSVALHDLLKVAVASGLSTGIDLGLAIAITDIAAGRMLQRHIEHAIAEDDPEAIDARIRMAGKYLAVLR